LLGITITEVYITPTVAMIGKEKAKFWDLYVVDRAGNHFEWQDLNLLEISEVALIRKCTVYFTAE